MRRVGLVLLLLVTIAGGYFYLNPRGAQEVLRHTPLGGHSTTTVYKWRDAQGNWQISDQPPPEGTRYETLHYRSDTNALPVVTEATDK